MSSAKGNKRVAIDFPECPICLGTMTVPIFNCQSGHSLCHSCTQHLCPAVCPICRQGMTQMRNWQLEEIVAKAKIPCPNKPTGCVYLMPFSELDEHLKECIFREMDCPIGVVFGRCSWNGKLAEMLNHFKERHPTHCNVTTDAEVELGNVNVAEDDRHLYLVSQGKMLFTVTVKFDTLQKMAYWTVHHIGSKKVAQQHIYEIHVTSKLDERRKAVFTEHCFNDAVKADEVFRLGKCAVLPLDMLKLFIKNNKLTFRFFIKRIPAISSNDKNEEGKNNGKDNKGENQPPNKESKGPGPKPGPKGLCSKKKTTAE